MSLPPEATESHTHLAHAVIRYLGLTAPEELVPFGINNAAGIVDLISRVRTTFGLYPIFEPIYERRHFACLVCNEFYHSHLTVVGSPGCLRLSNGCVGQPLLRPERCRRVPAIRQGSCESRTGDTSHRDT